jgi:ABC-type transport system involved in multi-copper enzyme maturation permease subunit
MNILLGILLSIYLFGVIFLFGFGLNIIIRNNKNNNIYVIIIFALHLIIVSLICGFYSYYLLYQIYFNQKIEK